MTLFLFFKADLTRFLLGCFFTFFALYYFFNVPRSRERLFNISPYTFDVNCAFFHTIIQ